MFGTVRGSKAKRAKLDRTHFKAASNRRYFAEMDKGLLVRPRPAPPFPPRSWRWRKPPGLSRSGQAGGDPRAERLERLDRGNDRFWDFAAIPHRLRPPQDHVLAPEPGLRATEPLPLSRPGKRALLQRADGAGQAFSDCGSISVKRTVRTTPGGMPGDEIPGGKDRSARQDGRSAPTMASRPV